MPMLDPRMFQQQQQQLNLGMLSQYNGMGMPGQQPAPGINPNTLLALGAGIAGGRDWGEGLSRGFSGVAQVRQHQQAEQKEQSAKQQTFQALLSEGMNPQQAWMISNSPQAAQFMAQKQQREQSQANSDRSFEQDQRQFDASYGLKRRELDMKAGESGGADFKGEQALRKEFSDVTKNHTDVRRAFARIVASKDDAAGDLSTIFGFMRMLDPASTVREGEFANAQNSAGIPDRVRNIYNQVLEGTRLAPAQRQQFRGQAQGLYAKAEEEYKGLESQYTRLAQQYRMNPSRIIHERGAIPQLTPIAPPPPGGERGGGQSPVRVRSINEARQLPSGTRFIDPSGTERVVP